MRQNQSQQSADTRQTAESTMDQGQRAMEQLIELQRNVARTTLSALEWQETAQQQGLELTRSMLQNTPGQQFTESMMQRYLQGMEAVMPEMERVMERGFEAASDPQMNQREQMGGQRERTGGQFTDRGRQDQQESARHGTRGRTESLPLQARGSQLSTQGMQRQSTGSQQMGQSTSAQGATDRQGIGQQPETPMGQQRGMQPGQRQGMQPNQQRGTGGDQHETSDHSRPHRSQQSQEPTQYAQTGEWVSPGEYGGESAGTSGFQQQSLTTEPSHSRQFEQGSQRDRGMQGSHQRPEPHQFRGAESRQEQGRIQHGESIQQSEQELPDRERGQSAQQRQSPMQTGQGRLREQYSQRIDPDRRGQGDRNPSTDPGQPGQPAQRERGEPNVTGETDETNETDRSPDRSARSAAPEGDADEEHDVDEE